MSQNPPHDSDASASIVTEVRVTSDMIRAYAARVGDAQILASDCRVAPPTFVLSLRRGFSPEVALPAGSFAMYGGHDLTFHEALRADQTYTVRARVIDTYEKSGRSGPMTIIARRAEITDHGGRLVTEMIERQVVRRRSTIEPSNEDRPAPPALPADSMSLSLGAERSRRRQTVVPDGMGNTGHHALASAATHLNLPTLPADSGLRTQHSGLSPDVGDDLGPTLRRAPSAAHIAGYADDNHVYESLFVDPTFAQSLGYRDVIVPGPMQTAFLEQFLREQLPDWRIDSINVTFRISVICGDVIRLNGVVTDLHPLDGGMRMACDLIIENSDGERSTTGHATLRHGTGGVLSPES